MVILVVLDHKDHKDQPVLRELKVILVLKVT